MLSIKHWTEGPTLRNPAWVGGRTEGHWTPSGPGHPEQLGGTSQITPRSELRWALADLGGDLQGLNPVLPEEVVWATLLADAVEALHRLPASVLVVHTAHVPAQVATSGLHRLLLYEAVRVHCHARPSDLALFVSGTSLTQPDQDGHAITGAGAWAMPGLTQHFLDPSVYFAPAHEVAALSYADLEVEPWLLEARFRGL